MKAKWMGCVAVVLAGYASPAHADITLGLVGPLTGQYSTFGEQMRRGAEQAVADLNAAGGIHGEKIVLKTADDACDPKQAVVVANQMVSAGVKYVVGHYCSGSAIPASKVFMEEGVLLISPAATNPKLTDEADTYIFRVCGRDDKQGEVVGQYILDHFQGKKIAILHDKSAYGRGLADQTKATLNKGGVTETMFEAYTAGERDYAALISKMKQAGVEIVFIGGYHTETGLILRQLREQGSQAQVIGGDALVTDELWSITGKAGEGVLMTFGPDPRRRAEAAKVVENLRKSGYDPEGYTLYTYAAVQVVADAIDEAMGKVGADKVKPEGVANLLRVREANTVLGPISFDRKGDVKGPAYVMYRWHEGSYAEIGP